MFKGVAYPIPEDDLAAIGPLRSELAALVDRLTRASETWSSGGISEEHLAAVTQILTDFQTLPESIAVAMTEALSHQQSLIMAEIRVVIREVLSEDRSPGGVGPGLEEKVTGTRSGRLSR